MFDSKVLLFFQGVNMAQFEATQASAPIFDKLVRV